MKAMFLIGERNCEGLSSRATCNQRVWILILSSLSSRSCKSSVRNSISFLSFSMCLSSALAVLLFNIFARVVVCFHPVQLYWVVSYTTFIRCSVHLNSTNTRRSKSGAIWAYLGVFHYVNFGFRFCFHKAVKYWWTIVVQIERLETPWTKIAY